MESDMPPDTQPESNARPWKGKGPFGVFVAIAVVVLVLLLTIWNTPDDEPTGSQADSATETGTKTEDEAKTENEVETAGMIGHKALYSMKLGTVRAGSNFIGVSGNMSLEMEKTCGGWTMSQNLRMDLQMPDGGEVLQDLRFSGWESDDGLHYRFFASNKVDGAREDFRGGARLEGRHGPGYATFKVPNDSKIPIPEMTMFPLGHTAWLIARARAGDRQASGFVFDGADGGGPQKVTAFIGPRLDPGEHDGSELAKGLPDNVRSLLRRPGWKIRMAFYNIDSRDSAPDYEVEILQLDNGVTPRLLLDYEEFTVILTQESLEEIREPRC